VAVASGVTLRSWGLLGLVFVSGVFVIVSLVALLYSKVASCFRVPVSLSVIIASGGSVVGFWSACRMSWVALAMMSFAMIVGMGTVVGNQVSVSAILLHLVSFIHIL